MEYSNLEVPSRSRRIGKGLALVALFIGLGCAALYVFGMDKQNVADMDPTVAMAAAPWKAMRSFMQPVQSRNFLSPGAQPSSPTINGCPACRSRDCVISHATVLLGSDSGGLVFVPDTATIKAGETVTFKNNVGFPHNVVFDEDAVPDGVDAGALSKEELLNAPGETFSMKFDKAGTYGYYCEPHQGAGMKGTIVVQ